MAISGGLRPTTLIRRVQPRSKWDLLDFALYEAHFVAKGEVSQTTGQPLWLTRSLDPNIGWMVDETIDQADAALDAYDKAHTGDAKKDGSSRFAMPIAVDGDEGMLEGGLAREHHFLFNAKLTGGIEVDDESAGLDIDRKMPPGGYDPHLYG